MTVATIIENFGGNARGMLFAGWLFTSAFYLLPSILALRAQDAASPTPPPAPASSTAGAANDSDPAAHQGYAPDRYSDLWTKSPFAVETPDTPTVTDSAEYSLVGVAQLGDVTYASLIQKQNQAHLLVSSDKPLGGLTLNSVSNKPDGVYVTFTEDGQPLTLKLEATPQSAGANPGIDPNAGAFPPTGGPLGSNIPMPGSVTPDMNRPVIHIRRPLIHLPSRFGQPNPPPPGQ
jgi:hypothetical protein